MDVKTENPYPLEVTGAIPHGVILLSRKFNQSDAGIFKGKVYTLRSNEPRVLRCIVLGNAMFYFSSDLLTGLQLIHRARPRAREAELQFGGQIILPEEKKDPKEENDPKLGNIVSDPGSLVRAGLLSDERSDSFKVVLRDLLGDFFNVV